MKISIYYAKELFKPIEAQIAYQIAWLGTLAQLNVEPASDDLRGSSLRRECHSDPDLRS